MSAHEQVGEVDVAALRAAAEGATAPMTCGGHRSTGSLMRCEECYRRNDASVELRNALTATTVLALVDRLECAERAVGAGLALADEWEDNLNPWDPGSFEAKALRAALTPNSLAATNDAPGTDNETPAGGTESA